MPTPAKLSAEQIYERIAPSVALIETPRGQDSGVLIEGGYVLTGAFFTHGYETVKVRLPGGRAFSEVPVHNTDLLAGVAILGPIDVDAGPLEFPDDQAALAGDTYLVGYSKEQGGLTRPSIAPAPIAGAVESEVLGVTHYRVSVDRPPIDIGIESDAQASPLWWHNSKPLVAGNGTLVGFSGFRSHTEGDTEDSYEYALSSPDVAQRIRDLISGTNSDGLEIALAPARTDHVVNEPPLGIAWNRKVYVLNEPVGTEVVVRITGSGYRNFAVFDGSRRKVSDIYEGEHGNESARFTVEHEGAYHIEIGQLMDAPMEFRLSSSHPVAQIEDPDDGVRVAVDGHVTGRIDPRGEGDFFRVDLEEGMAVRVTLASGTIIPEVRVQFGEQALDVASAAADLPDFFEASFVYTARQSGEYLIYAENAHEHVGAYTLAVDTLFPLPEGLSTDEILERVMLTVPLVETPTRRSTGVLLEDGYVLVMYSDIWPHDSARVVFPDGSRHGAPVHSVDAMANLALLGPVPSYIPVLAQGTAAPSGEKVYLIGYERGEESPLAAAALLSGSIDWEAQDLTYLRVDNDHLQGIDWEPGRVLVSEDGRLLGYSGLGWLFAINNLTLTATRLDYELALGPVDIMQRVASLIPAEGTNYPERWRVPRWGGSTAQPLVPGEPWQTRTYVLNEPVGTAVTLLIPESDDVQYAVFPSTSVVGRTEVDVVRLDDGTRVVTFVVEDDAPYLVWIRYSGERSDLQVQSSHTLTFFEDPDDGRRISKGEQITGNMDYRREVDTFFLQLDAGETVHFTIDSTSVYPSVNVSLRGATGRDHLTKRPDDERFWEHDFPPYTAQSTGEYLVHVSGGGTGAYVLSVD